VNWQNKKTTLQEEVIAENTLSMIFGLGLK
jgi:hypothetical protein